MARHIEVAVQAVSGLIPLESIPDDVKDDVEEMVAGAPLGTMFHATFDTEDEMKTFIRHAASYCTQRPQGKLVLRKSPKQQVPANEAYWKISADLPANAQANSALHGA